MDELKPCPFCGGEAVMDSDGYYRKTFWVSCTYCGCSTQSFWTEKESVEAWNKRQEVE